MNRLLKRFELSSHGVTVQSEFLAGLTTYLASCYIVFINPAILSSCGMPFESVMVATCLTAGILTILMGLYSNYPFLMAPGMGLNVFLSYTVVRTMGVPWQTAMGVVFWEGILILFLVLTRVRQEIMVAIPMTLKRSIGGGIGLFITFIGLQNGGLIKGHPVTLVTVGDFRSLPVLITFLGLFLTAWLMVRGVRAAVLIGISAAGLASWLAGASSLSGTFFSVPKIPLTLMAFDIRGALKLSLLPVVFSFVMVDFFDAMGTIIAVGEQANFLDEKGDLPRLKEVMMVDSLGGILGGFFGTSSNTTYVESAAGVAAGGRTGLAAVFAGLLFLGTAFFVPLAPFVSTPIPSGGGAMLYPVTASALIMVGFLMMSSLRSIEWANAEEGIPAFLTLVTIPFSFSISRGIGVGFISYCALKLLRGRAGKVHPLMYLAASLFLVEFCLV